MFTMMRLMGVQSAINEPVSLDDATPESPISREVAAIRRRLGGRNVEASAAKVTFLNRVVTKDKIARLTDADFLGYAVIVNLVIRKAFHRSYIFECVIREFFETELLKNNPELEQRLPWVPYLHAKRAFDCVIDGRRKKYRIVGSFFCQQNTITSVCAHAATTMMLNNRTGDQDLVSCEDINHLLGIDHVRRVQEVPEDFGSNDKATHVGLFPKEVSRVLREYKLRPYIQSFMGANRRLYRRFIYGFIESGFPSILMFDNMTQAGEDSAHVVAVVGHSLNRHSWLPTAYAAYAKSSQLDRLYLSSLNWVNDFIAHDDNFGMQLCLPAHSFRPEDYPDPGASFVPSLAIGALPEEAGVNVPGHVAEMLAWDGFSGILDAVFNSAAAEKKSVLDNYYVQHLLPHLTGQNEHSRTAVLRTILLPTDAYLRQCECADNEGCRYTAESVQQIRTALGGRKWVWVVEVTEPDLYVGNQSKVLDIIVDPTVDGTSVTARDALAYGILLVRLPHCLLTTERAESAGEEVIVTPMTGVKGHLPLALIRPR